MRFGTIAGRLVLAGLPNAAGAVRALDVEQASGGVLPAEPVAGLQRWDELAAWSPSADWAASVEVPAERWGPPVPAPRQVFAVALNYAPHAAESGYAPPDEPLVFTKFPTSITGPVATVELPPGNVDWEIEVVAVVGRGGYRIPRSEAWDALAGLTLGQDLSERIRQVSGKPPQFSLAKSHPGFSPLGPVVVTLDELGDPGDLTFASSLSSPSGGDVEVLQHGRTGDMVFPIDDLVARLSAVCPLLPGDLIFTGTPEGVGNRRTPPRFLQPGDTLISRLDGVGQIRQTFVR
jgi:2-keto-4-pentenoate hydratase/2-oxohepta-3-ene-1,7-dioic acid hydratase in catechol pathway